MENPRQLKKITFTKELMCTSCGYKPKPEDLGKRCPKCNGIYDLFDKVQQRQPFAQDRRQHGPI